METNYYLITGHGRSKMRAKTDDGAMLEAKAYEEKCTFTPVLRIVKETKQTIWETNNG